MMYFVLLAKADVGRDACKMHATEYQRPMKPTITPPPPKKKKKKKKKKNKEKKTKKPKKQKKTPPPPKKKKKKKIDKKLTHLHLTSNINSWRRDIGMGPSMRSDLMALQIRPLHHRRDRR